MCIFSLTDMKSKEPVISQSKSTPSPKPVINISRPIASQCRECLLKEGGVSIVNGIFSKSKEFRKYSVLLIQDLVHFGDVSLKTMRKLNNNG